MRINTQRNQKLEKLQTQLLETMVQINSQMADCIIGMVKAQVAARIASVQPARPAPVAYDLDSALRDALAFLGLTTGATPDQVRDAIVNGIEAANAKSDTASLLAYSIAALLLLAYGYHAAGRLASQ